MNRLALLLALTGCGGFSDADAKSATDAARGQLAVETLCAPTAPCTPAQVRALERMSYCANASMLSRHGKDVPKADPSIACTP